MKFTWMENLKVLQPTGCPPPMDADFYTPQEFRGVGDVHLFCPLVDLRGSTTPTPGNKGNKQRLGQHLKCGFF